MLIMAMVTAVCAAGSGATVWVDASALGEAAVSEPGSYAVWVWLPADKDTSVTVDGKKMSAQYARGKNQPEYGWVKAGEAKLAAGAVKMEAGPEVAAVALSTGTEFDPNKVQGDMRVFDTPRTAEDRRAHTVRHTDTVYTMPHFVTREAWESLAEVLRRRVLLSSGLYPLPEKTPLNAKIFDRVDHDDYSVEKAYFEARPGLLVTGNLYRPVGPGPFPAVVCPHGHWEHGRLENSDACSVPGRSITLARMGAVVFTYDMVGYVDSVQFPHNWGGEREKLWGLHPFAVQLWSSIRAVDFVSSLPDVDPERIGCTGASGGGTQTFALYAVDPRVKAAAPVNMISSTMQGGCLCENAPIIRMGNSNMEIGALMAPRPLLMISATGDWTRETLRVEYPAIRSIYALYGAEDHVQTVQMDSGHNYNRDSREAMYRFFGKWLIGGDQWANYTEPAFQVEEESKLRVFPDKKLPEGMPERAVLLKQIIDATRAKWDAVLPTNADQAPAFRDSYGTVLADVLGASVPGPNEYDSERVSKEQREGYVVERWIISRTAVREAIPALLYRGYDPQPQDAVVLVHGEGKAAFADTDKGGPGPLVAGLIAQGKAVLCIDPFLIGECNAPRARTERLRKGNFMDTFQPTDTGYRVQDVLTALGFLRARRDLTGRVNVAGLGAAGMWALFAGAIDGQVPVTVADLDQFPVNDDEAWVKNYYIPCIRSIGDVRTAAAMILPDRRLVLMNPHPDPQQGPDVPVEPGVLDAAALLEALR
jgi:hypothetical protein